MPSLVDRTGQRFGRLTVIQRVENDHRHKKVQWLCRCDCGVEVVVHSAKLESGHTKSCGCLLRENSARMAKESFTTHGLSQSDEYFMWRRAKQRAKLKNIPFTITLFDIVIPEYCPVLGLKLLRHIGEGAHGRPDSPSLDRLIPERGYVPGNVRVISNKANTIKQGASLQEIRMVADWLARELEEAK